MKKYAKKILFTIPTLAAFTIPTVLSSCAKTRTIETFHLSDYNANINFAEYYTFEANSIVNPSDSEIRNVVNNFALKNNIREWIVKTAEFISAEDFWLEVTSNPTKTSGNNNDFTVSFKIVANEFAKKIIDGESKIFTIKARPIYKKMNINEQIFNNWEFPTVTFSAANKYKVTDNEFEQCFEDYEGYIKSYITAVIADKINIFHSFNPGDSEYVLSDDIAGFVSVDNMIKLAGSDNDFSSPKVVRLAISLSTSADQFDNVYFSGENFVIDKLQIQANSDPFDLQNIGEANTFTMEYTTDEQTVPIADIRAFYLSSGSEVTNYAYSTITQFQKCNLNDFVLSDDQLPTAEVSDETVITITVKAVTGNTNLKNSFVFELKIQFNPEIIDISDTNHDLQYENWSGSVYELNQPQSVVTLQVVNGLNMFDIFSSISSQVSESLSTYINEKKELPDYTNANDLLLVASTKYNSYPMDFSDELPHKVCLSLSANSSGKISGANDSGNIYINIKINPGNDRTEKTFMSFYANDDSSQDTIYPMSANSGNVAWKSNVMSPKPTTASGTHQQKEGIWYHGGENYTAIADNTWYYGTRSSVFNFGDVPINIYGYNVTLEYNKSAIASALNILDDPSKTHVYTDEDWREFSKAINLVSSVSFADPVDKSGVVYRSKIAYENKPISDASADDTKSRVQKGHKASADNMYMTQDSETNTAVWFRSSRAFSISGDWLSYDKWTDSDVHYKDAFAGWTYDESGWLRTRWTNDFNLNFLTKALPTGHYIDEGYLASYDTDNTVINDPNGPVADWYSGANYSNSHDYPILDYSSLGFGEGIELINSQGNKVYTNVVDPTKSASGHSLGDYEFYTNPDKYVDSWGNIGRWDNDKKAGLSTNGNKIKLVYDKVVDQSSAIEGTEQFKHVGTMYATETAQDGIPNTYNGNFTNVGNGNDSSSGTVFSNNYAFNYQITSNNFWDNMQFHIDQDENGYKITATGMSSGVNPGVNWNFAVANDTRDHLNFGPNKGEYNTDEDGACNITATIGSRYLLDTQTILPTMDNTRTEVAAIANAPVVSYDEASGAFNKSNLNNALENSSVVLLGNKNANAFKSPVLTSSSTELLDMVNTNIETADLTSSEKFSSLTNLKNIKLPTAINKVILGENNNIENLYVNKDNGEIDVSGFVYKGSKLNVHLKSDANVIIKGIDPAYINYVYDWS